MKQAGLLYKKEYFSHLQLFICIYILIKGDTVSLIQEEMNQKSKT